MSSFAIFLCHAECVASLWGATAQLAWGYRRNGTDGDISISCLGFRVQDLGSKNLSCSSADCGEVAFANTGTDVQPSADPKL